MGKLSAMVTKDENEVQSVCIFGCAKKVPLFKNSWHLDYFRDLNDLNSS